MKKKLLLALPLVCLLYLLVISSLPPEKARPVSAAPAGAPSATSWTLWQSDARETQAAAESQSTEVARSIIAATDAARATDDARGEFWWGVTQTAVVLTQTVASSQATANAYIALRQMSAADSGVQAARYEADARQGAADFNASVAGVAGIAVAIIVGVTVLACGVVALVYWWRAVHIRQKIHLKLYKRRQLELHERQRVLGLAALIREAQIPGGERLVADIIEAHALPAPETNIEEVADEPADLAHALRWKARLKLFLTAGDVVGFGERAMTEAQCILNPDTGKPSSAGYRRLLMLARACGILVSPSGLDSIWAPGWSRETLETRWAYTALPYVPKAAPPEVRVTLRTSAPGAEAPHLRTSAPAEVAQ